ncbi:MAG: cytochrome c oxidase accessory protein CcoG [Myxococcota bacterium]
MSSHPRPELLPPTPYATATESGGRKWVYPKRSEGRYWQARRAVAVFLVGLYTALPHLRINGMPAVWLDIPARRFTLFGTQFWATDTLFLALFLLSVAVTIVAATALFGRIWCGWGCPQTVYMEFVFRPIENWLEGQANAQRKFDDAYELPQLLRKGLKWVLFTLIAMLMAHTFLAYFVSVDRLTVWMTRSPFEHPLSFLVMAGVTGLILFDFGWFREQMCTIACPYGRLQGTMMDMHTLRVGYDFKRGEPRGKLQKEKEGETTLHGDCIDCKLCVQTCPTGIDIRNGLQLECIGCTQCIDACDEVMDKIHKPRGLIRNTTTAELEGQPQKIVRPRLFAYAAVLLVLIGTLTYQLETRADTTVSLLRAVEAPYTELPDGRISNHLRLKISNKLREERSYTLELVEPKGEGIQVVVPLSPLVIQGGEIGQTDVIVMLPPALVPGDSRPLQFVIHDSDGETYEASFNFLGPKH